MMDWSDWQRFSGVSVNPAQGCGVGVYQVRATLKSGRPVHIHRACGVDDQGILYIGQGDLETRVGYLLNVHKDNPKCHHDFTSKFVKYGFDRICDREFLEFRWGQCDKPTIEERHLIEEYKKRFGDLPPGNLTLGG